MRTGRMDRLITLQKRTTTGQNTYGEEQYTYADVPVWAERRELRGNERFAAMQVVSTTASTYRLHYREDITVKDRLKDGADTYDIHAVLPIGRREGLELLVSHRGGQ